MRGIRKHKTIFSAILTLFFTMYSLYIPSLLHENLLKKSQSPDQVKISASAFFSHEQTILSERVVNPKFLIKKLQLDRCEVKHPCLTATICLLNTKTAKPDNQTYSFSVLDKSCILRI